MKPEQHAYPNYETRMKPIESVEFHFFRSVRDLLRARADFPPRIASAFPFLFMRRIQISNSDLFPRPPPSLPSSVYSFLFPGRSRLLPFLGLGGSDSGGGGGICK
jgi:hypothetical protein